MEILRRMNLSQAVSQRLLTLIEKGEVEAGGKLPSEPRLCAMLGVSRTALREGVKALAGNNLLTVLPGRGTFVNKNTNIVVSKDAVEIALQREAMHTIFEVRYALDIGIARFVALKATGEDVENLQRAVEKMEKALGSEPIDLERAAEGDEEFHLAFCRAAHNKVLENIAGPVITHATVRTWRQMMSSRKFGRVAIEGHKEILKAVENRKAKTLIDAVERHLEVVYARIDKEEKEGARKNRGVGAT